MCVCVCVGGGKSLSLKKEIRASGLVAPIYHEASDPARPAPLRGEAVQVDPNIRLTLG